MNPDDLLIKDLPDPDSARRFLGRLQDENPSQHARLLKDKALLSDILALVAFSPLLATTLLQHPDYLWWLGRKRRDTAVRSTEDLQESYARFALTNSTLDPQVLFARFRRRELLRIYLRDIRRLATVPEITEEISNLADAVLGSALKLAAREMDNRFGSPQETDAKGRTRPAAFCIVALGKLGSRELNYSSDIDLLFLYSGEGSTTGNGSRGQVTNREYFVKLAEFAVKLVGQQIGEGAAYRVDLRLRPHGTLGPLAMSVADTVRYYQTDARAWERQVLIRSRGCAGEAELYKRFFAEVEPLVFESGESIEEALRNVRLSKEKIDLDNVNRRGYNVKLGRGGIREIEFLAQALQLAFGGKDRWLRSPHTLISLSRLADRKLIADTELTELASAYEFLRRTEHVLQMENGVQTHTVPDEAEKRAVLARRIGFAGGGDFEADLNVHTENVHRVFSRIFGEISVASDVAPSDVPDPVLRTRSQVLSSIERSDVQFDPSDRSVEVFERLTAVSPHFAAVLAANPHLAAGLATAGEAADVPAYEDILLAAVAGETELGQKLSALRRAWSRELLEIVVRDVFETIDIAEAKRRQTLLAEASIDAALAVVREALGSKYKAHVGELNLAVLALGKLGGRGIDYDSDLDLIFVYDDKKPIPAAVSHAEFYSRAVELFVTTLSSMTRDGSLYRVDLRLRPYGSKGLTAMSADAFLKYMAETAAEWEMLAFVKLRAVGGDLGLGSVVESETRSAIHSRAAALAPGELRDEALRVRNALEKQRVSPRRSSEIDIKYGAGGMLDVYFAMRFLQLRDNVPDDAENRSTRFMLQFLRSRGSIDAEVYEELSAGYEFLSRLDHNLRLTIGRTTRVPLGNRHALETIARRMGFPQTMDLLNALTFHRLAIRSAFEQILG